MRYRFVTCDVFTATRFGGNQLAVLPDAEGLTPAQMQAVAAEFNYSETTFVLPPDDPRHLARVRIFTPKAEMPFAGHPTVGSAVTLAELRGAGDTAILVLEEKIGDVRCAVSRTDGAVFAEFDLPQMPVRQTLAAEPGVVGAALGLDPHEIGFENHVVSVWNAGVPYVAVPVAGLAAAAKARLDPRAWAEVAPDRGIGVPASAYVYCRETVGHDCAFHARMLTGGIQTYEDPATGSAVAAFAGAVHHFDRPLDGAPQYWIEQGIEMGRPSRIRLELDIAHGAIAAARIGGHAVKVAEGTLLV